MLPSANLPISVLREPTPEQAFASLAKQISDVASPLYKTEYLLDVDFTVRPVPVTAPFTPKPFVFANEVDPATGLLRPRIQTDGDAPVVPSWMVVKSRFMTPRYQTENVDVGAPAVVPVVPNVAVGAF